MKRLLIYGASNPEVVKLIDAINRKKNRWEILGFFDDVKKDRHKEFMGYPILGGKESLGAYSDRDVYFLNNVLKPKDRKTVADRLDGYDARYASLVPPAMDMSYTQMGTDCLISPGAQLGANTTLGNHVVIRMNGLVNHDSTIGDFVFIGPGAVLCGNVRVEEGAFIGAGAVIKDNVSIQAWSFIGMGAVVNRNIKKGEVVASLPARSVNKLIVPD